MLSCKSILSTFVVVTFILSTMIHASNPALGMELNEKTSVAETHSADIWDAVYSGQINEVQKAIDEGKNVNVINRIKSTPLLEATKMGKSEIVQALIDARADIDAADMAGETALIIAARNGNLNIVSQLYRSVKNIDSRNCSGNNAFMCAARKGHVAVLKLLLSLPEVAKHINNGNSRGTTALMHAISGDSVDTVDLLIRHGADLHHKDIRGDTPLMIASGAQDWSLYIHNPRLDNRRQNAGRVMDRLIEGGANHQNKNKFNQTALMFAAQHHHHDIADTLTEKLITAGANVNASDNDEWTPLMYATDSGNQAVVNRLLASGANVHHISNKILTAAIIAEINKYTDIAKVLRTAEKNTPPTMLQKIVYRLLCFSICQ